MKVEIGNFLKNGQRKVKVRVSKHDTYDIGNTLALVILSSLKKFKSYSIKSTPMVMFELHEDSWPENPTEQQSDAAKKKWQDTLDLMIYAFDRLVKDDLWTLSKEEKHRVQEGLKMFTEYYTSLWW